MAQVVPAHPFDELDELGGLVAPRGVDLGEDVREVIALGLDVLVEVGRLPNGGLDDERVVATLGREEPEHLAGQVGVIPRAVGALTESDDG